MTGRFMTRRTATATAATSLTGAALAACALPGAGGRANVAAQPTVGPATVTFTHWWAPPAAFGVAMDQALQSWAAKGSPVKVDSQVINANDSFTKYTNMLAGGTPPDLAMIQPFYFAPLHARGGWVDVSALARRDEREVKLGDFYPEPLVRVTRDGKLHGLPTDINVTVLLYNKNLLDSGGAKVPDDSLTWDGLLDAARALTRGEGADRQWGMVAPTDWEPVVWANGGEVLNKEENLCLLDQPAAYEAVQWLADLRHRHRVAPLQADLQAQDAQTQFLAGKIALLPWQSGVLGTFKGHNPSFAWGVALPPKGRRVRSGYLRGGNLGIMNGSRQVEAAWQVMKHLNTPEVHALWANPGTLMPPRKSVAESGAFLQPPPPLDLRKTVDAIAAARTPHFIPEYVEMTDIVNKTLAPAWNTGAPAAREACQEAKRQVDQLLAPRRK
ncbi:MAG: hypothetical protein AVDCRST_MAG77-1294 [uncultured Chloroflexi bacterium]|uniref:ABC transporter, substrate-binding protein (Cluster 1, maltose/g3p/polyamine/iron) n=1 Tax=uncultured Chloroflexota bacterium TaxID=166587 RepID=A0A6J4HUP6_9CHLR|nr:MAG: hypothetical protein AVDCRST_MAG77-1294 [uncultured Chloroflexota bacterium]